MYILPKLRTPFNNTDVDEEIDSGIQYYTGQIPPNELKKAVLDDEEERETRIGLHEIARKK